MLPGPWIVTLASATARSGLSWLDWLMIGLYVAVLLFVGWYTSHRQTTTGDYFVAGRRSHPLLVGLSIYAALLSTITYLALPGEIIGHGPVILTGLVSVVLGYVAVVYWLLPTYMKHRVTSAYELLEIRLGLGVRLLGASLFIVTRLVWMGVLIFMAVRAVTVILGIGDQWLPVAAAVVGTVALVYTSMGGLRAVLITDTIQFCLFFGGALLAIGVVVVREGGFGWFPTQWAPNWDTQPLFTLDPTVRISVFWVILDQTIFRIATAGGDQVVVQRFMATKDVAAARRSYLIQAVANLVVWGALAMLGFALLGYFNHRPDLLPAGVSTSHNADRIFPLFIAHHLPAGIAGLVVAGLLAAGLSSVDSGVNSITAVVTRDFLDRFGLRPADERTYLRFTRWLTVGIGMIVVAASTMMQYVPGNFLAVARKTTNLLSVPMFSLFVMALFVPIATPVGAAMGAVYGLAAAVMVGYWDVLTGGPTLSFLWIDFSALVVSMSVGCGVSLLDRAISRSGKSPIFMAACLAPLLLALAYVLVLR